MTAGLVVSLLAAAMLGPVGQAQAAVPAQPVAQPVAKPVAQPVGEPVAQGNDWRVDVTADGYRVTLRLAEPVPMRSALPLLSVDGKPAGVAQESADRRTLTLETNDPRVLSAKDVRLAWSTEPQAGTKRSRGATGGTTDAEWLKAPQGPKLPIDPGAPGKYQVETAEYNLGDQAVYLPGLKEKSELRGKVYSPRGAVGPRPLVIFLHGRHYVCYGDYEQEKAWPCEGGNKPVPSFRGYDAPAKALASHGYQVVSISANAVNGYDGDAYDAGAQARGELVLTHLDLWKKWSTLGGGPFGHKFVGKVNLQNVGLMGHSRGGEGVVRAATLNAARGGRYGIRAVLPLAPVDFARATLPGVAMSVILPYCDGDVNDLQGQKFYDDTRYSVKGDNAPRSTVLVLGANHNFFNTEWTPGQSEAPAYDDWWDEDEKTSPCGAKYAGRLSAKEQQAVGAAYVAGFFRLQLGRETALLPLLDGSNSHAASAGRAVVRVVSQAPAASRWDLNHFDQPLPAGSVTGKVKATICAGVEAANPLRAAAPVNCVKGYGPESPHWVPSWFAARTPTTAVTKLTWTGKDGVVRVGLTAAQRDVRRYSALSFRAAPDPTGALRTDLTVRVVDGKGRAVSIPVSKTGDALLRLPGSGESFLPKDLLRTVRIPTSSLKGIDLRDVRAIELRTDRVASGSVFVSDLAFSKPGLGWSAPAKLPQVSTSNLTTKEGDSETKYVDYLVTLSRPSITPVTVYAELSGELGSSVGDFSKQLVFKPGQTKQKVTLAIKGNKMDSHDVPFELVLSAPRQALLDNSFGHGLVTDDDPTPTLTIAATSTGTEGNELMKFGLRLSAPSEKFVHVAGQFKDGTAVFRKDYTSEQDDGSDPPPDPYFEAFVETGNATGDLVVKVLDDKVKEPAETFTAQIEQVEDAVYTGPKSLTGTIRDND